MLIKNLKKKFEGCYHDVLNETVMYHATDIICNSPLVTTNNNIHRSDLKIQRFCLIFNYSVLSSCQSKTTYHCRHYHILLAIYSFYTVYVKVDIANI